MIGFFKVPQISADDVKELVYAGLDKVAKFSTAGLQYAIEQHRVCILSSALRPIDVS